MSAARDNSRARRVWNPACMPTWWFYLSAVLAAVVVAGVAAAISLVLGAMA